MTILKERIHCVAVEIERFRDYFFYIPFILIGLDVQGASYVLGQAIMPSALYSVMILNSS